MRRLMSLVLAISLLFSIIPTQLFAMNNKGSEELQGKYLEEKYVNGKRYFVMPVDSGSVELVKNNNGMSTKFYRSSRLQHKIVPFSITPNEPSKDGAGQLINAAASIVWQTGEWEFPKEGIKALLILSNAGDRTGKEIATAQVTKPIIKPGLPSTEDLKANNFQYTTTKDYKAGDEKGNLYIALEVRYGQNIRVKGGNSDDVITNGKCYYFTVSQKAILVYTSEWYDNNKDTRPAIKGWLKAPKGQSTKVDLPTENKVYRNAGKDANGYIDELDLEGNEIKFIRQFDRVGQFDKDDLNLGMGQTLKAEGKFDSYEGVQANDSFITETKDLGNKDGKIPAFSHEEFNPKTRQVETKNYPDYFYYLVGDNNHMWRFQMREVLKVKLNSCAGMVGTDANKDLKVNGEEFKEIGHSEMIRDNVSGREISFDTDETITAPKVNIAGKEVDAKFAGWATDAQTLEDVKNSTIKGKKLVEADNKTLTDEGKTYKFVKDTTLYAVFTAPKEGMINVKYVDKNGTDLTTLDPSVKIANEEYPAIAKGQDGEKISQEHLDYTKAPKFLGYKITKTVKTDPTPQVSEEATYTTNGKYTVKFIYEKLDDIVGPLETTDEFPEGYVAVKFFADDSENDRGEFTGNKTSLVYGVNPINTEIDTTAKTLKGTKADGSEQNISFPTYTVKEASKATWKTNDTAPWVMNPTDAIKADKKIDVDKLGQQKDLTFTAQYEKQKGTVAYEYNYVNNTTITDPSKTDIPTLPTDATKHEVGTTVNAETTVAKNRTVEVKDNGTVIGTWKFSGWNPASLTIVKGENKFTGTWTFTEAGKHSVTYKFTDESGQALPAQSGELNKFPAVPTDPNTYYENQDITLPTTPAVGAEVKGTNGNKQGTWKFLGWFNGNTKLTEATVKAADKNEFVGKWSFTEDGKAKVTLEYKFFNGENAIADTGKFNPVAPTIENGYVGNDIALPKDNEVKAGVTLVIKEGKLQGTWDFKGWYKDEACKTKATDPKFEQNGSTFYGKWVLTEAKKKDVIYEFKYVKEGTELATKPAEITKSVPENLTDQYVGTKVDAPEAYTDTFDQEIDGKKGTWKFTGWTPANLAVKENPGENENKFVGTWTWTEKGKITVKYVFAKSGTTKDLPEDITKLKPTDLTGDTAVYPDNAPATPTGPDTKSFDVVEKGEKIGTWTTDGNWVKTTDKDGNITYTLTWTFTEVGKSEQPTVDPVKPGDKKITGKGKVGSDIVVELPDGTKVPGKVDQNGDWTVDLPKDKDLKDGDKIKVTQKEKDKKPSDPVDVTVGGKKPEPQPEPKPEPKPLPEVEIPGIKYKDHKVPTYPVYAVVEKKDAEKVTPEIFTHEQYIFGYPDDTIRPDGDMTRAEAIAVVARLQKLDLSDKTSNIYKDTKAGMWYNAAINAAFREGYLLEKEGENIRPNDKITRAELALLISHIDKKNDKVAPFEDVKGHKFEAAINQAYGNERIKGYPDGTFKPDNSITRAEVATMLNKLYDRYPDKNFIDANQNLVHNYKDMSYKGHWGYYELVEAYHTHKFARLANNMEEWKAIIK